jgi:hypothetical protein
MWIPFSPLVLAAAAAGWQAIPTPPEPSTMRVASSPCGEQHDFDFLIGSWDLDNRRLVVRHTGSTQWDAFPGHATVRPVLGGLGKVDEIAFPTLRWSGATLRLFNRETRQWWIYWANSRDGILQSPVVGGFSGARGEFFGDDVDDGRPVRVRYLWLRLDEGRARWEQAFALGAGATWETNWIMELRRVV